jgi:hypothetical protein
MDRFQAAARSHARDQAWVVLSWDPHAPRYTIRLDGYFLIRVDAERVAARGRWDRDDEALVLDVVADGRPKPRIPDALFHVPSLDDDPPPPPLLRHRAPPGERLMPCARPVPGDAPADADDRPPDPGAPLRQLLRAPLPGVDLGRV